MCVFVLALQERIWYIPVITETILRKLGGMSENKTNSSNLLNPENSRFRGQEKVNAEIFTAIEILGRKLERTEGERNRLAERLEMIESAASVDEVTGKIYLPAVIGGNTPAQNKSASFKMSFLMFTSMVSSVFAVASFTIVLLQNPSFSFEKMITAQTAPALGELTDKEKTVMVDDASIAPTLATAVEETTAQDQQADVQAVEEGIQAADETTSPDETALNQDVQTPSEETQTTTEQAEVIAPIDHVQVGAANILADEAAQADINAAINAADTTVVKQAEEEFATTQEQPIETANKEVAVVEEKPAVQEPVAQQEQAKVEVKEPAPVAEKQESSVDYISYDMPSDGDLSGALKKLEKAAYSGVSEAQHDIGVYYAEGQMVKQNYKRAIYWLKKASANGVSNASYNLAVMYQQGLGTEKNNEEALKYYNAAADLGHPEAMYNLGIIYFDGKGAERNVAKGISFFKRAAQAGVSEAAYNLGVLYESDLIGKADLNKAAQWYKQAAQSGYEKATEALKRLGSSYALTKAEKTGVYSQ